MKFHGENLAKGKDGHIISILHRELCGAGYPVSGEEAESQYFGDETEQAVLMFQNRNGLPETGEVDEITTKVLNKAVLQLKEKLRQLGHDLPEDNEELLYDELTEKAIRAFQEQHGLELTGCVDEATAKAIDVALDQHPPHEKPRPSERFIIQGQVYKPDGSHFTGVTVRAFDKDLRAEQPLGNRVTDEQGHYKIAYTAEQFRQAEKKLADLIVRVHNDDDVLLAASQVKFNARPVETIDVKVEADGQPLSEYEKLVQTLAPTLQDVDPADLTDDDIAFVVGDSEVDPHLIDILRQASQRYRKTQVLTEVFYGFGRQDLSLNLEDLLRETNDTLRKALAKAIDENVIPDRLRDLLDEILMQLDRLRRELAAQQPVIRHELVGQLVDEKADAALSGYIVRIFDLDADAVELNYDITNSDGMFVIVYNTPADGKPAKKARRFRLNIANALVEKIHELEIQVRPAAKQPIRVRIPIPAPKEPATTSVIKLAEQIKMEIPAKFQAILKKNAVETLADIRKIGGLRNLKGRPPIKKNIEIVKKLEAYADLERLSPDVALNSKLIENGIGSVAAVASKPRSSFVSIASEIVGDFRAAQMQVAARAQTNFLNNILVELRADQANNFIVDPIPEWIPRTCGCKDCEAAVSPLAYLADLLEYALNHLKFNNALITLDFLSNTFHQPFKDLPASCEAMDEQIRQVRICIEVLRSYLRAIPPTVSQRATLDIAEKSYRLAVYRALLTRIGTSFEEIRLARTAKEEIRNSLAERIGIDLAAARPDNLDTIFLDPAAVPAFLTEPVLEKLFGLRDSQRSPLTKMPDPDLLTWRLAHLRTLWKNQDWPADLPAEGHPLIDTDVIGPDDFRMPQPKANAADPDRAFDLWLARRQWVHDRLLTVAAMTKVVGGKHVPDFPAMFLSMYMQVTYRGQNVTSWANSTPPADFTALRNTLVQGEAESIKTARTRIETDLKLTVESFLRLVELYDKDQLATSDPRNEKVKDDEWQEVYSILVRANKVSLFPTWLNEEQGNTIFFGPDAFWISLRVPVEGDWPYIPIAGAPIVPQPMIDPDRLKLIDLPEPTAGERAIAFWKAREGRIKQIRDQLKTEREANGFQAMLRSALGNPNPGDPMPHDLNALRTDLNSAAPAVVDSAKQKIEKELFLTIESFGRMMAIRAKDGDPDPLRRPTAAEYAEVYNILTPAQKLKREYPDWLAEEQNPATGVTNWTALKAKLPRWRASAQERQEWQLALRIRNSAPLVDTDVINLGDLKNPIAGDAAYDLWQARRTWVDSRIAVFKADREAIANPGDGFDAIVQTATGVTMADLTALAEERAAGNSIEGRLEQLSLRMDAFSYLLRMRALAANLLDSEWDEVYAILTQIQKRRQFATWREQEKAANLTLGPDYFKIPSVDATSFPPLPPPELPAWLATRTDRIDWQDRLQARIDQEKTTREAVVEAVSAAEEETLPMLRDALILATNAAGRDLSSKAKWFTDRLLIDAKAGGCQNTTRISQAIETIQGLLFQVRTQQLADTYPTLVLDADDFDEEWEWIGSYATWRAAMFVFIYPENITLPSLRSQQTPAFRALVSTVRSNRRLTPEQACAAAQTYADYYRDVCSLRIEASCQTRTQLHSGDCRSNTATSNRSLFYVFGRGGATNSVFWSSYDPLEHIAYAQTFWETVPGLKGAVNLIGAAAYEMAPEERFLLLFARTLEKGEQKLKVARYDLEKQKWSDEPADLEIPKEKNVTSTAFTAVVMQHGRETNAPTLAIRTANGAIYLRQLNRDGSDWADGEWKPQIGAQRGSEFSELCAMVEISDDEFYLIARTYFGMLMYRLFGSRDEGTWSRLDRGTFGGAFSWPDLLGIYVLRKYPTTSNLLLLSRSDSELKTYRINDFQRLDYHLMALAGVSLKHWVISDSTQYSGLTLYDLFTLDIAHDPYRSRLIVPVQEIQSIIDNWIRDFHRRRVLTWIEHIAGQIESNEAWKEWKLADEMVSKFTFDGVTLKQAITNAFYGIDTNFKSRVDHEDEVEDTGTEVSGIDYFVPTSGAASNISDSNRQFAYQRSTGQTGIFRCTFTRPGNRLTQIAPTCLAPSVTGPFDITEKLTPDDLQRRAWLIEMAFQANLSAPQSNMTYLEEAYYFVPVHLALQLQSRGQYTAALDWFRTVYDYSLPIDQRKIYFGLRLEEDRSSVYERSDGWLLDPLNPHNVAATRKNTYTRFTLLALIRCFLDYADAEFTRDTAESVPRARILYMTALELLDVPELQQGLGPCVDIVGELEIEIGDPQWIPVWTMVRSELATITDVQLVRSITDEILEAMKKARPLPERMAEVLGIIGAAKQGLPDPSPMETVVTERFELAAQNQRTLLTNPEIAHATDKFGVIAAQDFLYSVANITGRDVADVGGKPIPWLRESKTGTVVRERIMADGRNDRISLLAPTRRDLSADWDEIAPIMALGITRRLTYTYIPAPSFRFCIPTNPILKGLRLRAELNLYKIHTCRNIAGMERQIEPYAAATDTSSGMPTIGAGGQLVLPGLNTLPPTAYHYVTLIERAKQLVNYAQQLEASMLSTLEKRDAEFYNLLKARQEMRLTKAGIRLQELRVKEAQGNVKLAELQQERANLQLDHYTQLLEEGFSSLETAGLILLGISAALQVASAIQSFVASSQPTSIGMTGVTYSPQGSMLAIAGGFSSMASALSTTSTIVTTLASYERRAQEWEFQKSLAQQDVRIGAQQVTIAEDHVRVVGQERIIAEMQAENAEVIVDFLMNKFTNVELYDWMSDILERVYGFFLQQATAMAQLASNQLAFERQEVPPPFIQADYWEAPTEGGMGGSNERTIDRRGLTGSARLLQDIYQLDQYAFETNQRKLQLTKTISLARFAPAEFQRFRETGVITFATPIQLFDRDFPGHYLRLIHRVQVSVVALIPAISGIRATLTSSRLSSVVIGGDLFQTVRIQRGPDQVALSAPRDAVGLFELNSQSDMLNPFEGIGVDTSWEFKMPKAANLFDYETIADVLLTIEYTALNSFDYQLHVLQTLPSSLSADRPFSFRHHLADKWYDLLNSEQTRSPMVVTFSTSRADFPPNLEQIKIDQVVLYFVRVGGVTFEVPVTALYFTEQGSGAKSGGGATSIDGVISTRRGNAGSWTAMIGKTPFGTWELALPNTEDLKARFRNEEITDILFVITYRARTPEWPM